MHNFKQISRKKSITTVLKKMFEKAILLTKTFYTLQTKNQHTTEPSFKHDVFYILIEDQVLSLIKNEGKFFTDQELFSYISQGIKSKKFDINMLNFLLEKLEKKKKIYEYRIPKMNESLWGQAHWLDKNMIPKKEFVNSEKYKDLITNYKHQCNLA